MLTENRQMTFVYCIETLQLIHKWNRQSYLVVSCNDLHLGKVSVLCPSILGFGTDLRATHVASSVVRMCEAKSKQRGPNCALCCPNCVARMRSLRVSCRDAQHQKAFAFATTSVLRDP